MEKTISILLLIAAIYLLLGILFSIPFLIKGIYKIDNNTEGIGKYFKAIILPGVILLWPVLLSKWMKS